MDVTLTLNRLSTHGFVMLCSRPFQLVGKNHQLYSVCWKTLRVTYATWGTMGNYGDMQQATSSQVVGSKTVRQIRRL